MTPAFTGPITAADVRAAWDSRHLDTESSRRIIETARDQRTLTTLASECGAEKSQVRLYLDETMLPEQVVTDLRDQLRLPADSRDRARITELIAELRAAGCSFGQIGNAVGLSRQRVAALSGPTEPAQATESQRRKPPAPFYRQPRSLTSEQLQPLHDAFAQYLIDHHEPSLVAAADTMRRRYRTPLGALSAHLGLPRHSLATMEARTARTA